MASRRTRIARTPTRLAAAERDRLAQQLIAQMLAGDRAETDLRALSFIDRVAVFKRAMALARAHGAVAVERIDSQRRRVIWRLSCELSPRVQRLIRELDTESRQGEPPDDEARQELAIYRAALATFRDAHDRFTGGTTIVAPVPIPPDDGPEEKLELIGLARAMGLTESQAESIIGESPGYARGTRRNRGRQTWVPCVSCGRTASRSASAEWVARNGRHMCPDCVRVWAP